MHLKRLTVHGFKSFADPTHFDFEADLTGIVGPNGCGKSNVVDALKWVLGDQRARSLRGKEMTDVIFKGAEGRDGAHQAEVCVTLTDENGHFGDRAEVTVGRRLNKEKESDYLLNGERVRLKDVRDTLMDTGLGVGAYSVMEQGRIDAVLSANPEDRRAIFEEAAGISRFKLQKRETLRKLDRTEQNLERVKDLLEERNRRIRSLKIQAGKARRYQELRAELRDSRTAVTVVEAQGLRAQLAEHEARLAELTAALRHAETRGAELEQARDELGQRIERKGEALEALQDRIRQEQSSRDATEQRARGHDQRAEDQRGHAADARRRIVELQEQHAEKIAALRSAQDKMTALEAELVEIGKELEGKKAAVQEAQGAVRGLQAERERLRQRVLEWMNDRTRARNAAHDKRSQLKALDARGGGLQHRHDTLDRELTAFEAEAERLGHGLRSARLGAAALGVEEAMILDELQAADAAAAELARQESDLRQQLSSVRGRLQILSDMESHMEGLDQGPRFLLEQQPPGLQGRLLDLVDADLEYSAALEAALGPFVQALVVESREHADAMHALLREQGKGRAILLVERELPDDLLRERPPYDPPAGARSLVSFIRYPGFARCIVHWLLRGVCLVDSLEQADPQRQDLCFVTPRGGLLCGPRIEGGSAEGQGGLVVRRATMQALTAEADALQERLDALLGGQQEVADRVAGLNAEARVVGEQLQAARVRIHGCETRIENLLESSARGARDLEAIGLELAELARMRARVHVELNDLLMRAFYFGRLEAAESGREVAVALELAAAQDYAEEVGRADQELQLRQVACRTDREAARDASRMHEAALRDLKRDTEALAERESQSLEAVVRHEAEAAGCRAAAAQAAAAITGIETERDAVAEELAAARRDLGACKTEVDALRRVQTTAGESVTECRLAIGEVENRLTWLETRLQSDVGIALRRCLGDIEGLGFVTGEVYGPRPGPDDAAVPQLLGPPIDPSLLADELALQRIWERPDFDADACAREVKVIQARIERLGSVNLDAVDELAEEESDFVLTEQEVKDLTEARASLIEALRRMERESRTLFEDTFRQARENFQVIFRKLFQGGRADMFLSEGEDTLEGGIEIMARPPGKELQSINLLSGGERTLTALAILFAVFKVKPSPFCILDEVDAALDDTNVERFLRVLEDFVGPTQFCIVTHHKRTMAACNSLYGVTMQRRGVSSRIAVSLDQVDQLSGTGLRGDGDGRATKQRIAGEEALGF